MSDAQGKLQNLASKYRSTEREIEFLKIDLASQTTVLNNRLKELHVQKSANGLRAEKKQALQQTADDLFAQMTETDRSIQAYQSMRENQYQALLNAERSLELGEKQMKDETKEFVRRVKAETDEQLDMRRMYREMLKNKSFESYVSAACCAFGKNLFGKRNDVVF